MSERSELIAIIASQLNNTELVVEIADWRKLLKLAKDHGILQYIALYTENLPEDKQPNEKIREYLFSVIMQEISCSANQFGAVLEMLEGILNVLRI